MKKDDVVDIFVRQYADYCGNDFTPRKFREFISSKLNNKVLAKMGIET